MSGSEKRGAKLPDSSPGVRVGGEVERRLGRSKTVARRAAVTRAISRQRLEEFQETLSGLAIAVFG